MGNASTCLSVDACSRALLRLVTQIPGTTTDIIYFDNIHTELWMILTKFREHDCFVEQYPNAANPILKNLNRTLEPVHISFTPIKLPSPAL